MAKDVLRYLLIYVLGRAQVVVSMIAFSFWLTPFEFGIISLHYATLGVLGTLLCLNIPAGLGRHIFDDQFDRRQLLGTAILSIGASVVILGTLWALSAPFVSQITSLPRMVLILQVGVALGFIAENLGTQVFIYQRKSAVLLKLAALKSALALALAVIGIGALTQDRYLGVIIAEMIVGLGFCAVVYKTLAKNVRLTLSGHGLGPLLRYSVPLIFYGLSLGILSQIDRFFLAKYIDVETAGTYGLAYTLGIASLMFAVPILNAFKPHFFEARGADNIEQTERNSWQLFAVLSVAVTGIAAFGPFFANLIFAQNFKAGFAILPLVALGSLAQIHFMIWSRHLAFENRTNRLSAIVIVAAGLNITLNLALIPSWGMLGAAFATALSQLSMAIGCSLAQTVTPQGMNLRTRLRLLGAAGLLTVTVGCSLLWSLQTNLPWQVLVFVAVTALLIPELRSVAKSYLNVSKKTGAIA
jgi:O-antigen/teichoic acid export membrane protein